MRDSSRLFLKVVPTNGGVSRSSREDGSSSREIGKARKHERDYVMSGTSGVSDGFVRFIDSRRNFEEKRNEETTKECPSAEQEILSRLSSTVSSRIFLCERQKL